MSATETEARLLALCDDVLKRAVRKGAREAECYAEAVVQQSANVEQNLLKGASTAEHEAIGIRLFTGAPGALSLGFAYVNHLGSASLDEAIDDALAIARASAPDPANGLVAPMPEKRVKGLFDDRVARIEADEVVANAQRLLDLARKHDNKKQKVSVDNGSFSTTVASAAIRSTSGVAVAGSETAVTWGLFGMAVEGDEVGSFDSDFDAVRDISQIDLDSSAQRFGERVLSYLGPKPARTYKGKVLFSAEAFEEIFLDALLSSVDGDAVQKGKSRLKDKLGQRIAVSGFHVVDDGTVVGGLGSASFDREGLPHRRSVLVGDGVLHTFLYDGKTARRANRRPSGHAQGSARSLPAIGTTNIRVEAGGDSEASMLKALGDGLYVGRFSGNVDTVSGDFSGVAKGSFRVKDGAKAHPVKETLIAGNAFEGLLAIEGLGAVLHKNMSTLCPWVLVDGVDVTAAE